MKKTLSCSWVLVTTCAVAFAQDVPKAELFFGYNYVRVNAGPTNVPSYNSNGASGQLAINLHRYFSLVADLGAYNNNDVGGYKIDNTVFSYMFGPRVPFRNASRLTPYINVLFGGAYITASTAQNAPAGTRLYGSQNAFAMAAGGGLDIRLNKYVSLRPAGLDYFLTRMQNPASMQDNNQNHFRYSAGISFTFGYETVAAVVEPKKMKPCWDGSSVELSANCPPRDANLRLSASQTEVCPGATARVTPSGNLPEGTTYQWAVNGKPVSKGPTFEFGSAGLQPGQYKVSLLTTAPDFKPGEAEIVMTVLGYRPPTGSLQASPAEIWVGERATLNASFSPGQCGGALGRPSISASEGSVSGNQFDSSSVQFNPSDNSEQRKTVRLEAVVRDSGGEGRAAGTVVVKKRAALDAVRLPDIIFPVRSARVNNCGKRVLLEDLRAHMQRDPGGTVVLVGHADAREKAKASLAQDRALNATAVISAGTGVCSSVPVNQIQVLSVGTTDNGVAPQPYFCGTSATTKVAERSGQSVREADSQAQFRRVEVWFVPAGGKLPASAAGAQNASTLPLSKLGCPK
jgi:hypothetical protein